MPHGILFHQVGDPKEVLKYEEIPKPSIEKPTQVLIKVHATSLNPSDLGITTGTYGAKAQLPASPGLEGMGTIEAIGSSVTSIKVGQRVHFQHFGTWRDYVVADITEPIIPIPDQLSDFDGAQLTVNPLTAVAMVHDLKVVEGEFLLQSAAASALGRILIQYAKAKGFKTINLVRRAEQVEELKKLGADYVINTEAEDFVAKVNEITKGAGVKYAVDCVGGATGTKILKTLGKRGQLYIYGRLAREPIELDPGNTLVKGIIIRGFWLMEWGIELDKQAKDELMKWGYGEIIKHLVSKEITLAVEAFPAKDFQAALEHCKKPGKNEKTILQFNQN